MEIMWAECPVRRAQSMKRKNVAKLTSAFPGSTPYCVALKKVRLNCSVMRFVHRIPCPAGWNSVCRISVFLGRIRLNNPLNMVQYGTIPGTMGLIHPLFLGETSRMGIDV